MVRKTRKKKATKKKATNTSAKKRLSRSSDKRSRLQASKRGAEKRTSAKKQPSTGQHKPDGRGRKKNKGVRKKATKKKAASRRSTSLSKDPKLPTGLRARLMIPYRKLKEINDFLIDPNNQTIDRVIKLVEKLGGPEAINKKAKKARDLNNIIARMKAIDSPYLKDVQWLKKKRDRGAFVSLKKYQKKITGGKRSLDSPG